MRLGYESVSSYVAEELAATKWRKDALWARRRPYRGLILFGGRFCPTELEGHEEHQGVGSQSPMRTRFMGEGAMGLRTNSLRIMKSQLRDADGVRNLNDVSRVSTNREA